MPVRSRALVAAILTGAAAALALAGPDELLYSQLADPDGNYVADQTFEPPNASLDCEAADDFLVDSPAGWLVTRVDTLGLFHAPNGLPPFFYSHISFYADAGGAPGAPLPGCDFPLEYNDEDFDGNISTDGIDCVLPPGRHWVSQRIRLDFNVFGGRQHFWSTRGSVVGEPAVWKNLGNGFGVGCQDWKTLGECNWEGDDLLFELYGQERPPGPPVPAAGPVGWIVTSILLVGSAACLLGRRRR